MASECFIDRFDAPAGTPPDPRFWRFETGDGGWGNGELQRYTADSANAFHNGEGHLVIQAHRDGAGFTSARLISKGLVTAHYGRISCRAKLPHGKGLWSAFWALGANIDQSAWPGCGEIDIMENLGAEPHRVFGTVHCRGHCGRDGISGETHSPTRLHDAIHEYAVDWSEEAITWLLDGQPYFAVHRRTLGAAWVFDQPFYLLVNLAVGGWLGGDVAEETRFPADLVIAEISVQATR